MHYGKHNLHASHWMKSMLPLAGHFEPESLLSPVEWKIWTRLCPQFLPVQTSCEWGFSSKRHTWRFKKEELGSCTLALCPLPSWTPDVSLHPSVSPFWEDRFMFQVSTAPLFITSIISGNSTTDGNACFFPGSICVSAILQCAVLNPELPAGFSEAWAKVTTV